MDDPIARDTKKAQDSARVVLNRARLALPRVEKGMGDTHDALAIEQALDLLDACIPSLTPWTAPPEKL